MNQALLFVLMLFAGVGIPIMAALNASMGQHLSNPIAAVVLLCVVATCAAVVLLLLLPQPANFSRLADAPKLSFLAGFFFILYIGAITYSAPKIGLANAVLMVLIGQVICAALIDHFGLFGVEQYQITLRRLMGFAVLAIGFWLVVVRH
ncbi:MAG: DMT family transporter [Rhodospirillaceae bacterium]